MDPQTLFMAGVAFVVIFVSLYLMSVFGMQEKTYEEVIEEQRRLNAEAEQRAREVKKEKKKEKKSKSKAKDKEKDKEKSERSGSDTDTAAIHKMVEVELEPEIIEPMEVGKVTARHEKSTKKPKSILHNKGEATAVKKNAVVEEMFHPEHMPKDEVEMKYDQQHQNEQKKSKESKKEETVVVEKIVKETVSHVSAAPPTGTLPPGEKKSKKSKTAQVESVDHVMTLVNTLTLNDIQLQVLIDSLLEKQGASTEWTKSVAKGDPLTVLKKQLEEKERQLSEEQQQASGANKKIKDLRQEVTMEKQKFVALDKNAGQEIARQQEDIQALHARMQQSHDQHMAEISQLQLRLQQSEGQLSDSHQNVIHRLQEENHRLQEIAGMAQVNVGAAKECNSLQQQLKIIQGELSNNIMKLNAAESHNKKHETQILACEERIRVLETEKRDQESVLNRKLNDLSSELRKLEHHNKTLVKDVGQAKNQVKVTETDVTKYKTQLQELTNTKAKQETSIQSLELKVKETEKTRVTFEAQLNEARKELQDLKQENRRLQSELQISVERSAGEGQEAPSGKTVNGDVLNVVQEDGKTKQIEEHAKILNEKNTELSRLQDEVKGNVQTITKLKEDLENQSKKNNILEEEKRKVEESKVNELATFQAERSEIVSVKSATISDLDQQLKDYKKKCNELETESSSLAKTKVELETLSKEFSQLKSSHESQSIDVTSLQQQIENQKQKNNELKYNLQKAEESQSQVTTLKEEVAWLKKQIETRVLDIERLTMELEDSKKEHSALSQESSAGLTKTSEELNVKITELVEFKALYETEVISLKQQLDSQKHKNNGLVEELNKSNLKDTIEGLFSNEDREKYESQMSERDTEIKQLKENLDKQQQLYDEIREKNSITEESLETKLSDAANEKATEISEVHELTKGLLKRILPEVSVSHVKDQNEWYLTFEKEALKCLESRNNVTSDRDTKEQEEKLQAQVVHYKTVLADTEGMLNKLQNSVESEEKKWQDKFKVKEVELQESNEKLRSLGDNSPSDEMEEKIKHFELKITKSEDEKKRLQTELYEANTILKSIKSDLEEARKSNPAADIAKQIDALASELDQEKKSTKELQTANKKLASQLKMGEDAFKAELEKSKNLEEQLTAKIKAGAGEASDLSQKNEIDEAASAASKGNETSV